MGLLAAKTPFLRVQSYCAVSVGVMPAGILCVQSYGGYKALKHSRFCAERGFPGTTDVPCGYAARPVWRSETCRFASRYEPFRLTGLPGCCFWGAFYPLQPSSVKLSVPVSPIQKVLKLGTLSLHPQWPPLWHPVSQPGGCPPISLLCCTAVALPLSSGIIVAQ